MAVEVSLDEAKARFRPPEPAPLATRRAQPMPAPIPRPDPAPNGQDGRIAALEGRLGEVVEVLLTMAEDDFRPKEPAVAEVFYGADGRVKSLRMGKFGASVSRDSDGRMRKININEI